MTAYDTSANVLTEVEDISPFTVSATGTITAAIFMRFLTKADTRVVQDDPGFTREQKNEACALLVCHQIARRRGQAGKTSEGIGRYSYSRKLPSGQTVWMEEYLALVDSVANAPAYMTSDDADGLTRDDADMSGLDIDNEPVYSLADEDEEED
jgi:hypothetical protein